MSREVAEEVGLEVQSVSYTSSQHWPFPHSSFMMGCHASVSPAHSQVSTGTSQTQTPPDEGVRCSTGSCLLSS